MSSLFEYILLPLFSGLGLGLILGVVGGTYWLKNRTPMHARPSSLNRQSVRVSGPGVVRKDDGEDAS